MSLQELQKKLPEIRAWIDHTLAAHVAAARPVSAFGFPRLGSYYSIDLLATARAVPIAAVPRPPLASMGLAGFDEFENMEADGITYLSSYFVRRDHERVESLHFHELVHVVQWQKLGPELFIMAYALGHLLSGGYLTNPLEKQAYGLQARFDRNDPPFDVASLVKLEVDRIAQELLRSAQALQ